MNMQGNLGRNIPQPQGMPQGIASLGGMSPSPRAGIGNVQDRVDAFRQNPQALQTPPNVPPDLLDAIALQKIMSQKEAVKREMAMAAPGQQPTVIQQLEQKALGDTKQEIAQQVGGVAQKQAQDQQQAMQRLMSGIAQAPGAGQVMPARMASGGIVAFQDGGDPKLAEYNQVKRQLVAATNSGDPRAAQFYARKLQELRAQIEPELLQQAEFETSRAEAPSRVAGMLEGPPPSPQGAVIDQAALDRVRDMTERGPQFDIRQPPSAGLLAALQAQSERVGPSERMGLQDQIAKMQRGMPPAAPAGPGISGLGAAPLKPEGVGQGITMPQGSALPQAMQQAPEQRPMDVKELLKQTGIDEEARAAAAEQRARAALGASPEEKAYYAERLARLQKPEPEKRWYERLAEFAPYLSQQRIQPGQQGIVGDLGRIASAGAQMGQAQKTAADKRQAQIDAALKEQMDRAREERMGIYKAGEQARTGSIEQQLKMGQLGAELAGQQSRERMAGAEMTGRERISAADRDMQEKLTNLKLQTQRDLAEDEAQLKRELALIKETGGDKRAKTMQRYYESWEKLDPIQKTDLAKQGIRTFNDYTRLRDAISQTPFGGARAQPAGQVDTSNPLLK